MQSLNFSKSSTLVNPNRFDQECQLPITESVYFTCDKDGRIKTAMDIFLNFQQMGCILAPFGIAYRTHGAEFPSNADRDFFRNDELLRSDTRGVVTNVIEMMRLNLEEQRKGRLITVSE